VVFVLFRRLVGMKSSGTPDTIIVLAAVLPWQFFSSAMTEASMSLLGNSNLISKVYFPRLIVPFAAVVTAFADFLITLGMLAVLMAWYGVAPSPLIVTLPLFALLVLGLSLGLGLFLSALNVEYRDFRYVVPFIVQVGLFVSPIAFTSASVPARWRTLYLMNPLVGIVDGFRWAVLGDRSPILVGAVSVSIAVTVVTMATGLWYFRRMERRFADVI
jgi:lipopolysaccharide transport system permease protein